MYFFRNMFVINYPWNIFAILCFVWRFVVHSVQLFWLVYNFVITFKFNLCCLLPTNFCRCALASLNYTVPRSKTSCFSIPTKSRQNQDRSTDYLIWVEMIWLKTYVIGKSFTNYLAHKSRKTAKTLIIMC